MIQELLTLYKEYERYLWDKYGHTGSTAPQFEAHNFVYDRLDSVRHFFAWLEKEHKQAPPTNKSLTVDKEK